MVFTSVLWLVCLAVGTVGLVLPYSRPRPPVKAPEPLTAEKLVVELTNDPLPPVDPEPAPPKAPPPALLQPLVPPTAPPLTAVAQPSPAIAFALPVPGPVRIVEAKQASHAQVQTPPKETAAPVTVPQTLTYGRGEGRQPAPEYPRQAMREGQEGSVGIRFSVGENGRVLAAEVASRSPWPLLNEAAARVVRERWRFSAGAPRVYEVSIRFELRK